jgi:hypothetical protein
MSTQKDGRLCQIGRIASLPQGMRGTRCRCRDVMVYPFLRDKKTNPDPSSIFRARRDLLRPKENKPTIPRIANQSGHAAQAGHFPLCMSLQVQTSNQHGDKL